MDIKQGIVTDCDFIPSPHHNDRPTDCDVSLLVLHNISLPPGKFSEDSGSSYISDLFLGTLDASAHPYFEGIADLQVSAHCLIGRRGEVIQYVPFHKRAWHAGVSVYQGRQQCNDYAIGIELEGTDELAYTQAQYSSLIQLTRLIMQTYPKITLGRIVGHNDIAPGRKTDPGFAFNWGLFRTMLIKDNK